jgi:hypothetical protein
VKKYKVPPYKVGRPGALSTLIFATKIFYEKEEFVLHGYPFYGFSLMEL